MKTKFLRFLSSFLLVFAFGFSVQAQSISGTVSDENGVPLPGATVLVEGTQNGVSTDFDGNYSIDASSGDTLVFSFVGYSSQSVVVGSSATVNVSLQPDNALSEVVVTALGVKRNVKAVGYSITQVGGEELSDNKTTNAINALQGKVAGVMVTGSAMGAKGSSRVVIRGTSSLTGKNQPLDGVDGSTINNSNLGSAGVWGGGLRFVFAVGVVGLGLVCVGFGHQQQTTKQTNKQQTTNKRTNERTNAQTNQTNK